MIAIISLKKEYAMYLDVSLRAINPTKNVNRVYNIKMDETLFNSRTVITERGRYGKTLQPKIEKFNDEKDLKRFLKSNLRKRLNAKKRIGCDYMIIKKDYSAEFKDVFGEVA